MSNEAVKDPPGKEVDMKLSEKGNEKLNDYLKGINIWKEWQ